MRAKALGLMLASAVVLGASTACAEGQAPAASTAPSVQATAAAPATPLPHGQWVYTSEYGWIWVPEGATTVAVDDVPYVYLYTPEYGWTWYVSPWGWGPFYVGEWVARPWHPRVWHGWVAAPHVTVRLGPMRWYRR